MRAGAETTAYAPSSPYAASKAAANHFVRAWERTFGPPLVMSNCSNNYGLYHFPEKLIPLVILNALDEKPLPIYGQGRNVRDWLYVDDHSAALETVLTKGTLGESYRIGGRSHADRPGHDRRNAVAPSKIERHLEWRATESFESGILKTVDWYLAHDWWRRPIRERAYAGERLGKD